MTEQIKENEIPVEQEEPMHPEAKAEMRQRISLAKPIEEEIILLKILTSLQNNKLRMQIFEAQAESLERIMERWRGDAEFVFNKETNSWKRIRLNGGKK